MGEPEIDDAALEGIGRALERASGLALADGLRERLREALALAAEELRVRPPALARAVIAGEPGALELLAEHAVVAETHFWRQPEGLLALAALLAPLPRPLALWSAGCATGEEPYGLAIALLEAGRAGRGDRILATDLSARALARARAGRYGARALRHLPPALAARWLVAGDGGAGAGEPPGGGAARVDDRVRALVEFERHGLLEPPPGGGFDAVVCRNVLIYFERPAAVAALARLLGSVRPGGFLVTGPVELALAAGLAAEAVEVGGATLLRRPAH